MSSNWARKFEYSQREVMDTFTRTTPIVCLLLDSRRFCSSNTRTAQKQKVGQASSRLHVAQILTVVGFRSAPQGKGALDTFIVPRFGHEKGRGVSPHSTSDRTIEMCYFRVKKWSTRDNEEGTYMQPSQPRPDPAWSHPHPCMTVHTHTHTP